MKKNLLVVLFVAGLLTSTRVHAGITTQNLVKGQSTTITVDYPLGDVAITDDEICDYVIRDNRREIYLNPRKAGSTKMTLWDADGKKRDEFAIHVQDITRDAIYQEAVQKFGAMKEVKIELSSGWIVLSGKVGSRLEYRQIQEFAQKYPQVENGVRLAPEVVDTMIHQIEREIGVPGVRVRQVRGQLLLEGLVYSKELYKKAETIARLYAPEVVNLIEIQESSRRPGKDRLVQIDVHLMEIKKSALRSFGVSWTPGVVTQGGTGTAGFFQSLIGTITNLLPKITWVRQSGNGRVLENPKMIVKSGETGDFFSGTTVPYRSERAVEFKDAGIRVKASPIATANDVDLQIEVELSALAPGGSGNIDKNNLKTTIFCPAGKSVVLAGIISNRDTKVYNKTPSGADAQIALVSLAASKDFQTNQSEFFIFLTPTILHEPTSAESELSEWLNTQEQMIRDRSKKEFGEYAAKKRRREWETR